MSLDKAIEDLKSLIAEVSPDAVIRVSRHTPEEASIRAYAPASDEQPIKDKTRQITQDLLLNENLDVQVIFYDIATSLPPDEMPEE
jgi:hypothetical protein